MQYEPLKDKIALFIEIFPILRKFFYKLLDLFLLRQWYVKQAIQKEFDPDKEFYFFDAGAGFCQYSDFVLTKWKKASVFALDLKSEYIEAYAHYAKTKFPGRFHWNKGNLVTFFPKITFDLIIAIDILEHIEDDRGVLRNFYNCLKTNGKLIISTPSNKDETARFTAEHVRPGYNPTDLIDKLTDTGFTIKSLKYTYGKWGSISWKLVIRTPLQLTAVHRYMLLFLPLYYLLIYPISYLLMVLDTKTNNISGNGLLVIAEKK